MSDTIAIDGPRQGPESGGAANSLVVFLHGLGADGNDLISLAPLLGQLLPDTAFVAPDAPQPCDMAPTGRQWFSLQTRDADEYLAGVSSAAPVLDAFLDQELEKLGLSEDRLAVIGFSQGTMTALYTCPRRPNPCAAIVGFSGSLIAPERLAEETKSRPPILLVHGEADPVVPFQAMPAAAQALVAAGFEVSAHARPGLAHGIDQEGLQLCAAMLVKALGGTQ
ncbi:MAG: alpha/beta fold hydrolase [Pseudomonadota bacterium]